MPIVQQGALNTTALVVPDLYVQIVPPSVVNLNGVPTNNIGVVGTAQWGPVDRPVVVGNMSEYSANFGAIQNRTYDMGTQVALCVMQGAQAFTCVRVTDGTDAAATVALGTSPADITFTAAHTGTLGNSITVSISAGGQASSWNVIVGIPGYQPEIFRNITGSGAAFWTNVASAINNGQGPLRPASQFVTATAGTGTTAAAAQTVTLAGGSDGVATITSTVLVGSDTAPYTGMYALQNQGCSIGLLADATDPTTWSTQVAFGLTQGIYMVVAMVEGTAVSAAPAIMQTSGAASYALKVQHGDWLYWWDAVNAAYRLVSPAAFAAGRLANLSPEQSSLNKPLYGIAGSQSYGVPGTSTANHYADADLQTLFDAGIDVITNPVPGGNYWGVRGGINSSLSADVNGDNYTRMTNYIAATLNAGMGLYIGRVINAGLLRNIRSTLLNFLGNMLQQGQLGSVDGSTPYSVVCDTTNNPQTRTALGYVQADVQVQYQGINRFLIVNLEGGQTVTVSTSAG